MRWRFIVGIGLALALTVGKTAGSAPPSVPDHDTTAAQTEPPTKEPVTPLILRVVLLTPSDSLLSDPGVQKILEYERAEREKAHRKPGSFVLRLPGTTGKPPPHASRNPKPPTTTPKTKE